MRAPCSKPVRAAAAQQRAVHHRRCTSAQHTAAQLGHARRAPQLRTGREGTLLSTPQVVTVAQEATCALMHSNSPLAVATIALIKRTPLSHLVFPSPPSTLLNTVRLCSPPQ